MYARGARARFWTYVCHGDRDKGQKGCWTVAGARIDEAVEKLFLETMVPSELELSLAVDHEVASQAEELAKQWRARREQAAYEARRAEKRTRPWTQTTAWWREHSNASGRSSSGSWRRWSGSTPRPAAPGAWIFRRKIGRECASWRAIYRRCSDRR